MISSGTVHSLQRSLPRLDFSSVVIAATLPVSWSDHLAKALTSQAMLLGSVDIFRLQGDGAAAR
jgi:hypothetical protein